MHRVTPLQCPLLVGRDDLLDLADRRLADARANRGQFLLLAGPAGVGKTRLLGAWLRKAEAGGIAWVKGDLAPQDQAVPAALILELARTMTKGPPFERLGNDLLALTQDADGDEARSRRKLVLRVVDLIVDSLDAPTILAFEDLQWADELSLEIVAELARRIQDRPVMIVGAYRTDELPNGSLLKEWRARLLTQRMAEEARLAPLTLEQTALMTTLILASGLPAPRDVVAAVYERTDGLPLHIEELLGALSDEARGDGRSIREATVPATIEDAVIARFENLSPDGQAVAQAGAVIGRCFSPDVLAGIMDLPLDALEAPLQELVDHAFLYPFSTPDAGFYDYRHQLLRDALYRTVRPGSLRRLHARAGEFGARLEGATEIHASVHFERAGLRAQAYRAALAGARDAARLSSHREAFELYRRAIANLPDDLEIVEHATILEAFGMEAAAIDLHDQVEPAVTRARDLFLEAGRSLKAAEQLCTLTAVARRECRPLEARAALIAKALQELEPLPPSPERDEVRGLLLIERAQVELDGMDIDAARRSVEAARELARRTDDRLMIAGAGAVEGMIDVVSGDIDGGLDRIVAIAAASQQAGFEDPAVTAYRDAATTAVRVMRYRFAEDSIKRGVRYADSIEQSHCRHVMRATGALIAWADGRWDDAFLSGGQELVDKGCSRGAIGAEIVVGYVEFGRGRLAEARELLDRARTAGDTSGNLELILPALWGLAETDLLDDHPVDAIHASEAAYELAAGRGERALLVPFAVTGVRALLAAGRPEAAGRWVRKLSAYLGPWPAVAQPALDHAIGLVRLASGSTGVARDALQAAVTGWDERGRVWEATWARLDLAGCMLRSSRYAEASSLVATARATAERLESHPLSARVAELAAIASRHGSFDEPWRPLTTREFEVARLIADGRTNAEIAGELAIAPKTASAHVEHILAKLGVARRTEIATWVASVAHPAAEPATPRQGAIAAH